MDPIQKADSDYLKAIKQAIEDRFVMIEDERIKNTSKTREQIIQSFGYYGYIVPKDAKFWRVMAPGKGYGGYGMELGRYEHSCHVDSSELITLLVVNGNEHFTDSYSDIWLSGPF